MIRQAVCVLAAFFVLLPAPPAAAQGKKPTPGFNMFSKDQDVEIGQQGVEEIEKSVRLVTDPEINKYVQTIGSKLAAAPDAAGYPYTFKVVWDDSINAFALPGGPTYVNTGLILAAENEAQIAGVMGHEISHVALRHGTNQASKASFLQIGAMLGASALGGGGIAGTLAQLGIGFGANSVLLKFSRGAERDADILGAYIMSEAGYNPVEEARFFEKLEAETGQRGKVQQFFSDHPNPGNRMERIEQEIQYMPKREYNAGTGQLSHIQELVRRLGSPPEAKQGAATPAPSAVSSERQAPARASSGQQQYQGRAFELAYPDNWHAYESQDSVSVTFVPEDGIVQTSSGGTAVARGVVADVAEPEQGKQIDLRQDTDRLIASLHEQNPSMRVVGQRPRRVRVNGNAGLLTTLRSESPFQGLSETDLLLTVERSNKLYYMVFISPSDEYGEYQPTFENILKSVKITF